VRCRPRRREIELAQTALAPWRWITSPEFHHIERVPRDRPVLLVGNHTLMGLLDIPLMVLEIWERRGVFVRSLGDHVHFKIPGWRDLLLQFGTVEGSRENCSALMRERETVLVFPGGAREVFKRKGESYRLLWGQRTGFARMAIEHGYSILPFAALGADDCFDVVLDAGDLLSTRLGGLLQRVFPRIDELPPVVRGIGPLPVPRPQKFYFFFDREVDTAPWRGRHDDPRACFEVREETRRAIERGIAFLKRVRSRDPQASLLARAVADLRRLGK
jgi:hypothetical protein